MNVLVDTNVLIDYVCNRSEFCDAAESLFALGMTGQVNLFITDISIVNALYVGRKYGFSSEQLSSLLHQILSFAHISIINDEVIHNALTSDWKDKEDAVQYYSAIASLVDVIITRNVKDFSQSIITILTPGEFLTNQKAD